MTILPRCCCHIDSVQLLNMYVDCNPCGNKFVMHISSHEPALLRLHS